MGTLLGQLSLEGLLFCAMYNLLLANHPDQNAVDVTLHQILPQLALPGFEVVESSQGGYFEVGLAAGLGHLLLLYLLDGEFVVVESWQEFETGSLDFEKSFVLSGLLNV